MTTKFAIVGCGRVSKNHAKAIMKIRGTALKGLYDVVPEKMEALAKETSLRMNRYHSLKELCDDKYIDAVCVCTPPSTHYEIAKELIKAGKNVVIEKPVTLIPKHAEHLDQLRKKHRVKVWVVHQNRYNEPVQYVKERMYRLGKPLLVQANLLWQRPQKYYDQEEWYKGNPNPKESLMGFGGGTLMNQGIHIIDILLWFLGDVKSVMAYGGTLNHKMKVDDEIVAVLKFRNGCLGTLTVTTNMFPHNYEETILLTGTEGTAKIGGTSMNKLESWRVKGSNEEKVLNKQRGLVPPSVYGFGHDAVISGMMRNLCYKCKTLITIKDGLKALKTTRAVYKAIATGKEVKIK